MRTVKERVAFRLANARERLVVDPSLKNKTELTKLHILNSQLRIQHAVDTLESFETEWREIFRETDSWNTTTTRARILTDMSDIRDDKLQQLGNRVSRLKSNRHSRVVKAETAFRLGVIDGDTLNHIQNLQNSGIHNGRFTLTEGDLLSIALGALEDSRLAVPAL